uniref:Tick transposon n=1 Tax=Rhipicephalus appendiculatus TaxID=34631 RepID=A0A131YEJ2_RHIAP
MPRRVLEPATGSMSRVSLSAFLQWFSCLIPVSCGVCCIGRADRCLTDRGREHRAAVIAVTAAGHMADQQPGGQPMVCVHGGY